MEFQLGSGSQSLVANDENSEIFDPRDLEDDSEISIGMDAQNYMHR